MPSRPLPVIVAAILLVLLSLLDFPWPYELLFPGAEEPPAFILYSGYVVGIAGLVVAIDLWMLKPWSLWATIVVCVLNFLFGLPGLLFAPGAALKDVTSRARLVGFNHVAIVVGDIEEALDFYGRLFEVYLRGRGPGMAFIDAGDQFIALSEGQAGASDDHRHIGLVVDDRRALRRALREVYAEILPGRGLDFLDPWGNRWQVVEYGEIQFTKAPNILTGMGLGDLKKAEKALEELRRKGLDPE